MRILGKTICARDKIAQYKGKTLNKLKQLFVKRSKESIIIYEFLTTDSYRGSTGISLITPNYLSVNNHLLWEFAVSIVNNRGGHCCIRHWWRQSRDL